MEISVLLSGVNNKLNLVGNPYPSPISISAFFAANTNIENIWRKQASANLNASKAVMQHTVLWDLSVQI